MTLWDWKYLVNLSHECQYGGNLILPLNCLRAAIGNFDHNVAHDHCCKTCYLWLDSEYPMVLRVQGHICKNKGHFDMGSGGSPGGEWFLTCGKFASYFHGLTLHKYQLWIHTVCSVETADYWKMGSICVTVLKIFEYSQGTPWIFQRLNKQTGMLLSITPIIATWTEEVLIPTPYMRQRIPASTQC